MINSVLKLKRETKKQRCLPSQIKAQALLQLADDIEKNSDAILNANSVDLSGLDSETTPSFRDRLLLNFDRIQSMAKGLRAVANLPDPVGEEVDRRILKSGLFVRRVRSPLGVILLIFESRPNVILEAFSLAFKSGNSIVLRGGSESKTTAAMIYKIMRQSLSESGVNFDSFYGLEDYDRRLVHDLLQRSDLIDVVVPRGGEKLITYVQANAKMPIIKNDRGLCHTYVDQDADLEMAVKIVTNAKTQRPGVCNSLETVLVHQEVAKEFLPMLNTATRSFNLEWRVDEESKRILSKAERVLPAKNQDWDTEYLDLIMNCKIVQNLDEALLHIEEHGSRHSEAIVTATEKTARRFQTEVDAAVVYWNASTRFTDGFEFGLGGELGISTQKLHARGPVGLKELTIARWIIDGTGQTRT
jgi:glutamate-5-semialdehyde dehydrogenase